MKQCNHVAMKHCIPGQSLMEILIGIGVMGIVLAGIAGLVSVSLQSVRVTREKSIAQSLIHDTAAAVKGIVQSDWHDLWSSLGGRGYWPIDEGVGAASTNNLVLDQIYGNNGTITLGSSGNTSLSSAWTATSSCQAGQCLTLDGIDDYLSLGDPADGSLDFATSSFTIGLWVYPQTEVGVSDMPWWKGGSSAGEAGYDFELGSGGWVGHLADGSSLKSVSLGSSTTSDWVHLMMVIDRSANVYYGYRDGEFVASTTLSGFGSVSSANSARLGSDSTGSNDFNGRIDEVRIYSRALTAAEVSSLYSGISALYPTQSAGTWQIKEGKETQTIGNIPFTRSFTIDSVMRDGSNNIVTAGGTDDPLSKLITYTVAWRDRTLSETEYIFRTADSVFTQTDWSGGLTATTTVFTAPTGFMAASSGLVYSTAGYLSNELGTAGSSTIDTVYRYAWNDVASWIDFYPVSYSSATTEFSGIATSSFGNVSMNCADLSICGTSNYKVYQATSSWSGYAEGDLYGYGWSDVFGWMSFNCNQTGVGGSNTCATVDYNVYLATSTGDFYGYSWNDVIGWTSFNCADLGVCGTSDYKVKLNTTGGTSADMLESLIFDTQMERGVIPAAIVWQGTLGTGTQVKFQIASSNSASGSWTFVGSDGTASSYYPASGSAQPNTSVPVTPRYHFNHRYLRYKVYLTSSSTVAPSIEDISLLWKK